MLIKDLMEMLRLPRAVVNLMSEKTAENDPFYARVVQDFYREASARHPKLLLAKKYEYGFTLCKLPKDFNAYFMEVEASARRNYRKAIRLGYRMTRFDFNTYLNDVRDIWLSTPIRQGELLPEDIRTGQVTRIKDPPSWTPYHDYPYFGIFKEEKLLAYAGCLVSGELCNLNDIYGHTQYQGDSVVPLLIIEIARVLIEFYPNVKYYSYGTYFGASDSMQRFKRKFLFNPHHVKWVLGTP